MSSLQGRIAHSKIKTAAEIAALIGARPRDSRVAMCHGTFDIVHPGHVRHLVYAKSKADILIASLTADRHVTKADKRPFIPEALRAFNLAALEAVDYVLIDQEPTPLANIALIQPDLFAKGYEYAGGQNVRTVEERATVEGYGGEILFTPGDVVYSSSRIIETARPSLAADKLIALLDAEGLGFGDLRAALGAIAGLRVHVVGDTIIDGIIHGAMIGSGSKTPTISVRRAGEERFVGGAGIVAQHLRAAGADVTLSTVLGSDKAGVLALDHLTAVGIECQPIVDTGRPTTLKEVVRCTGYDLLKIDTVDNRPVSQHVLGDLTDCLRDTPADIVIFSDFRHGIFNRETIPALSGAIPDGAFRVADSQVASRWGNILEFRGFDLLTPNEREARFALGDQDSVVRPLGSELYARAGCGTLILKLGERGSMTFRSAPDGAADARAFFALDSFADHVIDAVGTGDALLAYAAPVLKATGNAVLASVLGSLSAAVECGQAGNIPVTRADVAAKLDAIERVANYQ